MRLVLHAPREMVDRAHAPHAAPCLGGLGDIEEGAGSALRDLVAVPAVLAARGPEAHHVREERGGLGEAALADSRAVQAPDLMLRRDGARLGGREGAAAWRRCLDERYPEPVRVGQRKCLLSEARLDRADRRPVASEA